MRKIRVKRKVREREIRVAWWNGRPYSYPLWENIEGGLFVGGRDIGSACHVKRS